MINLDKDVFDMVKGKVKITVESCIVKLINDNDRENMMKGLKKFIIFVNLSVLLLCINLDVSEAILVNNFSSELNPTPSFDLKTASDGSNVNFPLTATSSFPERLPEFFYLSNYGVISKILEETTNYFYQAVYQKNGLFRDAYYGGRGDYISAAATGFGLTALTMSVEHGMIYKDNKVKEIKELVKKGLKNLLNIQNKQIEYEKELNAFLEQKAYEMEAGKDKDEILAALDRRGWERFYALEKLRKIYEADFLIKKRGLKDRYKKEYKKFLEGREPSNELEKRFRQEFVAKYSDIFKYGRWGFFYRYLNKENMERAPGRANDLSTIDTAIAALGALVAGYYFGGEIKELSKKIYKNIRWHMFLNPHQSKSLSGIFSIAWLPESGFIPYNWDFYSDEVLLITLLALGSPTHSVSEDVYQAFKDKAQKGSVGDMSEMILAPEGGLWKYHMNIWLDTHNRKDEEGINWYQNSVKATLANRNIVLNMEDSEGKTLAERYKTFNEHLWPITAMWTPLANFDSRWAQSSAPQGGYHMDIGVVRPDISPIELYDKIPPLVAPNGYGGSIIHSLYSFLGMRYLGSTEENIWGEGGFYPFSYDIDFHERLGGEWFSPCKISFDKGMFLQMFNLLGEIYDDKKSIWEITNDIPYFQKAFKKAGLEKVSILDSTPDELLDGMREEVAGEIENLSKLIDSENNNKEIIERFDNLIDEYLTKDKATMGEYDELVRVLKGKLENRSFNPIIAYMIAEARMAQIRNIAIAATGEKYVNQGDYYKTFEAIKYYFKNADKYYEQAKAYLSMLSMAQGNILSVDSDSLRYLLNTRAKALDFILTKNTFEGYTGQKELFKETAGLINKAENPDELAEVVAEMIYRYDWEAELSGALSYDKIYDDLLYWEEDYDFDEVRTPTYQRLE